jgi:hypothetical protein
MEDGSTQTSGALAAIAPRAVRDAWNDDRAQVDAARTRGDAADQWAHLERAHILSEPAGPHPPSLMSAFTVSCRPMRTVRDEHSVYRDVVEQAHDLTTLDGKPLVVLTLTESQQKPRGWSDDQDSWRHSRATARTGLPRPPTWACLTTQCRAIRAGHRRRRAADPVRRAGDDPVTPSCGRRCGVTCIAIESTDREDMT